MVTRNRHTIPQERFNTDFVRERQLGLVVRHWREIPQAVTSLQHDPARREAIRDSDRGAAHQPRRLRSARDHLTRDRGTVDKKTRELSSRVVAFGAFSPSAPRVRFLRAGDQWALRPALLPGGVPSAPMSNPSGSMWRRLRACTMPARDRRRRESGSASAHLLSDSRRPFSLHSRWSSCTAVSREKLRRSTRCRRGAPQRTSHVSPARSRACRSPCPLLRTTLSTCAATARS